MKNFFTTALIFLSLQGAMASTEGAKCINEIKKFVSLQSDESIDLDGLTKDNQKCRFHLKVKLDEQNLKSSEAYMSINVDNDSLRGSHFFVIGASNNTYSQKQVNCKINKDELSLNVSMKEVYGWKRRLSYKATLVRENGKLIQVKATNAVRASIFNSPSKDSETCNL